MTIHKIFKNVGRENNSLYESSSYLIELVLSSRFQKDQKVKNHEFVIKTIVLQDVTIKWEYPI